MVHQNHQDGLVKDKLLGPTPRVADSTGLEWSQNFAFLTSYQALLKLLTGPGNVLWEPLLYLYVSTQLNLENLVQLKR